ncbi:MAG: site-specific DNA-methyltransferase [Solirubrobacterales bacterium]|nr:MAG: site-specific DNA-methyltransferase [Solirubrobacterales bacterium]
MKVISMNEASSDFVPDDDLIIHGDCGVVLRKLPAGFFDAIYIDPPFNTGSPRSLKRLRAQRDPARGTPGFGGHRYTREVLSALSYEDAFDDFLEFIGPKLGRARELLAVHGTLYFHIDYREAHYCKVLLDTVFGRDCFLNEIIWAYDYGARTTKRWPAKHDTILVYVKDPERYWFNGDEVDREPYMAPGLQTAERAAKGKLPTDVWWHTIVPTKGPERTGYPTQKPEGIVRRMLAASSKPGGWCLDFFAGSGTLASVACKLGRRFVVVDSNAEAVDVMTHRLGEQTRQLSL